MTKEEASFYLANMDRKYMEEGMSEALDMAIKALSSSENPNKWIPVSERLPEDEEEVLCFLESEEMAVLFRRNNWGQYEWVDGGFATGSYDVIAWMPLPAPAEPEESEE